MNIINAIAESYGRKAYRLGTVKIAAEDKALMLILEDLTPETVFEAQQRWADGYSKEAEYFKIIKSSN